MKAKYFIVGKPVQSPPCSLGWVLAPCSDVPKLPSYVQKKPSAFVSCVMSSLLEHPRELTSQEQQLLITR